MKTPKAKKTTSKRSPAKKDSAQSLKTSSIRAKTADTEARPFPPSPRPDLHAETKSKKTKPSLNRVYEPAPHEASHLSRAAKLARSKARLPIRQPAREVHLHTRAPESQTRQHGPSRRFTTE